MTAMFGHLVMAAAVAVPITLVRADDDKNAETKKEQKRVEVKVLRLDDKDHEKPQVKVFRAGPGDERESRVIVSEPGDSGDEARLFATEDDDKPAEKQPYLGVAIEPVPPALIAHLPGMVSKEQGVLVAHVADDSPAAKAGLKEHDILVSYDDQRLSSGEQLTKLVRGDKPGRDVVLGVVRAGKMEKVKVSIGEHEAPRTGQVFGGEPGKALRLHGLTEPRARAEIRRKLEDKAAPGAKVDARTKSTFSSMKLESLDGDRFKASVDYKNEKGDSLQRSFEGTRDEIRKEIEADKEMPEPIRNQLLRSLDLGRGGKSAFQFNAPGGGFSIDSDWEELFNFMPTFRFPDSSQFDQIIEQLSENLDPETREKLKGAIRKIEPPKKGPADRDRSL